MTNFILNTNKMIQVPGCKTSNQNRNLKQKKYFNRITSHGGERRTKISFGQIELGKTGAKFT